MIFSCHAELISASKINPETPIAEPLVRYGVNKFRMQMNLAPSLRGRVFCFYSGTKVVGVAKKIKFNQKEESMYAHVHPDETIIPYFPKKIKCDHQWRVINIDDTQLKQYGVTEVTLRCELCSEEMQDWWQREDH